MGGFFGLRRGGGGGGVSAKDWTGVGILIIYINI